MTDEHPRPDEDDFDEATLSEEDVGSGSRHARRSRPRGPRRRPVRTSRIRTTGTRRTCCASRTSEPPLAAQALTPPVDSRRGGRPESRRIPRRTDALPMRIKRPVRATATTGPCCTHAARGSRWSTTRAWSPTRRRRFAGCWAPAWWDSRWRRSCIPRTASAPAPTGSAAAERPGTPGTNRWRLRRPDGTMVHAEVTLHNLLADPEVRGMVVNVRDTSHTRMLMQRLKHDAFRDPLTGLPNRVAMLDRVAHRARALRGRQGRGRPLPRPRRLQDRQRQPRPRRRRRAADRRSAERLRDCLRAAGHRPRGWAATSSRCCWRAWTTPRRPARWPTASCEPAATRSWSTGRDIRVRASIGIAMAGRGTERRRGDAARRRRGDVLAKERGKARYEFFDERCAPAPSRGWQLRDDLQRRHRARRASSCTTSRWWTCAPARSSGVEALVRWRAPAARAGAARATSSPWPRRPA